MESWINKSELNDYWMPANNDKTNVQSVIE